MTPAQKQNEADLLDAAEFISLQHGLKKTINASPYIKLVNENKLRIGPAIKEIATAAEIAAKLELSHKHRIEAVSP